MKYKIGDVARILGISPDLLRYYEKKGVVAPEKNKNNSYRYYDSWDINFLTDCLWFKNFGFSIERIADIVRIPSSEELGRLFLEKEGELRSTIKRCELLLQRSEEHRRDLATIDALLGACEISQSPANVSFVNRIGNEYISGEAVESDAERWLQVMPFNRRYFEMPSDLKSQYSWGYCLTLDYAEALGFAQGERDKLNPECECVHTVFKSSGGRSGFAPELLQYALDYATNEGKEVCGEIRGVLLASVMENDELYGYFEAWIPVK